MARPLKRPLKRHQVDFRIDKRVIGTLDIVADRTNSEVRLSITHPKLGPNKVEAAWKVDWSTKSLSISPGLLSAFPKGLCLAGCLVGAGASFAGCLWNANSEDDVWNCIDGHVVTLGASVLACVLKCLE